MECYNVLPQMVLHEALNAPTASSQPDEQALGPNRVSGAHWPTKENKQKLNNFCLLAHRAGRGGAPHRGRTPLLLCAEEVEPWLTAQWQTEKSHILLAEDGHISFKKSTIFLTNLEN